MLRNHRKSRFRKFKEVFLKQIFPFLEKILKHSKLNFQSTYHFFLLCINIDISICGMLLFLKKIFLINKHVQKRAIINIQCALNIIFVNLAWIISFMPINIQLRNGFVRKTGILYRDSQHIVNITSKFFFLFTGYERDFCFKNGLRNDSKKVFFFRDF